MKNFGQLLMLLLAVSACQPSQVLPQVDEVSPNWGYNAEPTEVVVLGDGFFAGVGASDGAVDRYDRDFVVSLVGPQGEERLEGVTQVSETKIAAVVPPGLPAGWYGVRVVTPGQVQANLWDAFEVTGTKADSLAVQASSTSLSVSGMSIVRIKVLNPDGAVVQEPFPVTVRLEPSRTGGEAFDLDSGNLLDVEMGPQGLSLSGQIGPTGEAFVIVSSSEPDDMLVEAEVSIRDRAVIAGGQLISFKSGEVAAMSVDVPADLEEVTAGAEFDVILSLVDEEGNRVSGQPATVALAEGCGSGGWGEHITFVDTAVVSVAPTRACDANTIEAFGVVEGGSVSGTSRSFAVRAGPQAGLAVLATPEVIQAGIDDVVFFVQGQDAWDNPTVEPLGPLSLYDEHGAVSEGNGNGTFSCEAFIAGTAQCVAQLYEASASRVIRVETDSGREGLANPIQVIPGPGDRVAVDLEVSTVVAGESFTAQVSAEDAFGNPIILGTADLGSMVFSDEFGGAGCSLKASDVLARRYEFDCSVTVASDENELHVQIPTLGVIGHSERFTVEAGSLASVVLTIDEGVLLSGVDAGDSFPLAVEGLDAFGNRVTGAWSVTLRNVAGGMDVTELTLLEGVAFQWVVMTRAALGDSIWALSGTNALGGTPGFDVRPGAATELQASVDRPWAFVGQGMDVSLALVDEFGNPTEFGTVPYEIDPVGGLGPVFSGVMAGTTRVPVVFDEAGLGEDLLVQVGDYSTVIPDLDVALECGDSPRELVAAGVLDGRLCLGSAATVSVDWDTEGLVHTSLTQDGQRLARGDLDGIEVEVIEVGETTIEAMFVGADACGEVASIALYGGAIGAPVGPVGMLASSETLISGADGSLSTLELLIEARECSGDPAAFSPLTVRTDRGAIIDEDGMAVLPTGEGLQVVLDEAGEAMVAVSTAEATGAGPSLVVVGSESGAAIGLAEFDVSGDSLPPSVLEVSPSGTVSGWLDEVVIRFSERMLWIDDLLPAGTYFDVTNAAGEPVAIAEASWGESVRTLTLAFAEPVDVSSDVITLELFDTLRDASGNRLDGDVDGEATGDWIRVIGDVIDDAPDVTRCEMSAGWFRPDGDDGEGVNADYVWLSMEAEWASDWWRIDVIDPDDGLVARHLKPRVRPLDGSFVFDGRDASGRVLEEGLVVLQVHAMDEYGNVGAGCRAAVVIDQVVSLR